VRDGLSLERSGFGDLDSERYFRDQGITADVSERRCEKPLVIKALLCPEGDCPELGGMNYKVMFAVS